MTTQKEIISNADYIALHNAGFVGIIPEGCAGSDELIERCARVSYGKGTRSTSDTQKLLRYLIKHHHTSPLEMGVVMFHIKLPIFVMRQLIRHRTASVNEYSARYSILSNEFFVPEQLNTQSTSNKQGRGTSIASKEYHISRMMQESDEDRCLYEDLLDSNVSREQARIVLPVSVYTECYWKINLHNFLHFLNLRLDIHAQKEIRDYAEAMLKLAEPRFPIVFDAWNDLIREGAFMTGPELKWLRIWFKNTNPVYIQQKLKEDGWTQRDITEFLEKIGK